MVLIVNGEKIEDSAIEREAERLRPEYERTFAQMSEREREEQLREWSKENVIEQVLLRQYAQEKYEQIPAEEVETGFERVKNQFVGEKELLEAFDSNDEAQIKKHIESHMKFERLMADISKDTTEPCEEEIQKYYDENKEDLKVPERVRVAHTVKHVDGRTDESSARRIIEEAREKIERGEVFETIVAEYSDCTENGGDLGYIQKGQMVEEFEDVVFNLGVGEISEVFESRYGFHIAKVYDRQPAKYLPFSEVKENIAERIKQEKQQKVLEELVDELKSKALIEKT